jgi:pimeloyl-ACP methyl ester carboxylesterase
MPGDWDPNAAWNALPAAAAPSAIKRVVLDDGTRLAYREWGDPAAPALVLLHGGGLSSAEWTEVGPRLAGSHRVVAPDARGCGWSDPDPELRYGVADIARDLEELRPLLGLDRFALAGHSFGAVAGCLYAAERPEAVTRLVLVDGGPADHTRPSSLHDPPLVFATRADAARAVSKLVPRGVPDWYLDERFVTRADGMLAWRSDIVGRVEWSRAGGEPLIPGLWPYVEALAVPTLVLRGADSPLFPAETAARMAAINPLVRVLEVPDAGHFVHLDQPDVLVDAVGSFLA